jgi:hypothetical protein
MKIKTRNGRKDSRKKCGRNEKEGRMREERNKERKKEGIKLRTKEKGLYEGKGEIKIKDK